MSDIIEKQQSKLWWLVPIFLGIIGGIIMYLVLKDESPKMAKKGLYLGIILTIVEVLLYVLIFSAIMIGAATSFNSIGKTVTIKEFCGMVSDNYPKSQKNIQYNSCMTKYKGQKTIFCTDC